MKTLNVVFVVVVSMALIILATLGLGKISDQYQKEQATKALAELVYEDGLRSYCNSQLEDPTQALKEQQAYWSECSDANGSGLSAGQWYRHALSSGEAVMPEPTPNGDASLILVKKLEASFNNYVKTQVESGSISQKEADDLKESIQFI